MTPTPSRTPLPPTFCFLLISSCTQAVVESLAHHEDELCRAPVPIKEACFSLMSRRGLITDNNITKVHSFFSFCLFLSRILLSGLHLPLSSNSASLSSTLHVWLKKVFWKIENLYYNFNDLSVHAIVLIVIQCCVYGADWDYVSKPLQKLIHHFQDQKTLTASKLY